MKRKFNAIIILIVAVLFSACQKQGSDDMPAYKDANLSVDERVDDLLSRMTVEEKMAQTFGQLCKTGVFTDSLMNFSPEKAKEFFKYGFGQIGRPSEKSGEQKGEGRGVEEMISFSNEVQRFIVENTRLGIPVIFHEEALHGLKAIEATSYPQPIGLACTFNEELAKEMYTQIAKEVRYRGAHQVLTPVVDIPRDARWGRVEETYGEDPYLTGQMGLMSILGFQGEEKTIPADRVIATLKHFVGHGWPETGSNVGPTHLAERELREIDLYPFQVGIQKGGLLSIMSSYNEVAGVPSHTNKWLNKDLLLDEWDFQGYIVSDYGGVSDLIVRHSVAKDNMDALVQGLEAGVDNELPNAELYRLIPEAIEKGLLKESVLDDVVRRILRVKFLAGLFENPYTDPDLYKTIDMAANAKLSLQAAKETIVMLKNDGTLPLNVDKLNTIAVIGPNADKILSGGYSSSEPISWVTPLEGITKRVAGNAKILYSEGCSITDEGNWWIDDVVLTPRSVNLKKIAAAVKVARQSDVIILCVGSNEAITREAWTDGHMGDKPNTFLYGEQRDLYNAMKKTGKPVVVVLSNGAPLSIPEIDKTANGILECWYIGQETGTAMAEVIFGDYSPSGRMSISVPRSAAHIPCFYNHKPSARRGYAFDDISALYSFGFGLSYAEFVYSNLRIDKATIPAEGIATVSVDVTNKSDFDADEVIQLYVRDKISSVTRPVKELKDFDKLTIKAGETVTVSFELDKSKLSFWNLDMDYVVEPGEFNLMVGPTSMKLDTIQLTVQ